MKCVVIGLGEFGFAAAVALAENGAEVIAIDREMHLVESIKDQVDLAVCLDASRRPLLEAHEVASADVCIAAIGRNFEAQVLAVAHASNMKIERIVARAMTPTHAEILREVGADEVLNPEESAARRLVQGILVLDVAEYFELGEGFSLTEVLVPHGALGHSLIELKMRTKFRLNVVGVKSPIADPPGSFAFNPLPDPGEALLEGQVLAIVGSDLDLAHFLGVMASDA